MKKFFFILFFMSFTSLVFADCPVVKLERKHRKNFLIENVYDYKLINNTFYSKGYECNDTCVGNEKKGALLDGDGRISGVRDGRYTVYYCSKMIDSYNWIEKRYTTTNLVDENKKMLESAKENIKKTEDVLKKINSKLKIVEKKKSHIIFDPLLISANSNLIEAKKYYSKKDAKNADIKAKEALSDANKANDFLIHNEREVISAISDSKNRKNKQKKEEIRTTELIEPDNEVQQTEEQIENKEKGLEEINKIREKILSIQNNLKKSVWKDKDGNFNKHRLLSDGIAGVVLGTAGGIITSTVMKKVQVKNGYEDISCTVNGQNIASFGDEFNVGIK